jgi:replicative DNA helicase
MDTSTATFHVGRPNGVSSLTGRDLPQDIEAEQALLGALLIDESAFALVRDQLSTDDFYVLAHQRIYGTCAELAEDGNPLDPVTLHSALDAKGLLGTQVPREMPFDLAKGLGTAANVRHYAGVIAQLAQLRRFILVEQDVLARAFKAGDRAPEFMGQAVAELQAVAAQAPGFSARVEDTGTGLAVGAIKLIRAIEVAEERVEWLIPNFIARSELTDLSGDPGVGKTGSATSRRGCGPRALICAEYYSSISAKLTPPRSCLGTSRAWRGSSRRAAPRW